MRNPLISSLLALILVGGCASSTAPAPTAVPTSQPVAVAKADKDTITLATYNVEHFNDHFRGFHMEQTAATQPANAEMTDLISVMKRMNNENQWEVAQVISDPAFSPDILAIEEGPEQSDLDFFNRKWLNGQYATAIVFPSNSQIHQTVCLLLKPGFKILERRDQYYKEPDAGHNTRGSNLFARGPAFLLVESPTGYRFWVGATHQKSKSGNSLEVTQWRNRESKRTHEIMKELERTTTHDVILLGDMNDALGPDEFEKDPASGGDAVANLVGPPEDGFMLATRKLAGRNENSFHGYYNPRYRELIDHAVVSKSMWPRVRSVEVFHDGFTSVASDHFPVMIRLDARKNLVTNQHE